MESPFPRAGLVALSACAALLGAVAPAAGAGGIVQRDVSEPAGNRSSGFWTPQRIRSAPRSPLPMRAGDGGIRVDPAAGGSRSR